MKFKLPSFMLIGCLLAVVDSHSQTPPLVYAVENSGSSCAAPILPAPGDLPMIPMLPDPFAWSNGSGRSLDFADWECRRNEIKTEIEHYEIGSKQPVTSTETTFAANVLTVKVKGPYNAEILTLKATLSMPTTGTAPYPIVIGMNSTPDATLFPDAIRMQFTAGQVVKYGGRDAADPYFKLYPQLHPDADTWLMGAYSAWSWGVSRLIDGLQQAQTNSLPGSENYNVSKIAVNGCSYAGKMALFAGAFDERIALTMALETGGGGAPSWRASEALGFDVEKISNTDYSWFMPSLRTNFDGREGILPYDHHELMAMIAPRALLVTGNADYLWLSNESGYISAKATEEVYKAFNLEDRFGFIFDNGHDHCAVPASQTPIHRAFIEKFLLDSPTANTDNVRVNIYPDTDYLKWIEKWSVAPNPNAPTVKIITPTDLQEFNVPATFTITTEVTDLDNNITKVEFFSSGELLGEDTTAPYAYTWANVEGGEYSLTAVVTDADGNTGDSNIRKVKVIKNTTPVYRTFSAPTIDGSVDEMWNDPAVKTFDAKTVLIGTGPFTEENFSGSAKAMWDDTYVYVLAQIKDDVLINDSANNYQDDAIEFYFDGNNAKTTSYQAGNDVQYTFRWNDAIVAANNNISVTGIEKSMIANITGDGYVLEAKIPWANIGVTPSIGQEIGFDFMAVDDDNGGDREGKISWNSASDNAYQNTSVFGTIELAGKIPTGEVYKVDTPPTIDGIVDEVWNNPIIERFSAKNVLIGGVIAEDNLSGYAQVIWDNTNVYLLAQVKDNVLIKDSNDNYQDDNIEIYFDGNNAKSTSYQAGNDVQYTFRWNDDVIGRNNNIPVTGIVKSMIANATADGYILEASIPWANFGVTAPANGQKIGFDFMIGDDDDGGNRDAKLSWNAIDDSAWQSTAVFGTITLSDTGKLAVSKNTKTDAVIIYPNPATNQIWIQGINNEFEYTINDFTGKLLMSGKSQNNINIDHLRMGVYLLNIKDGTRKISKKIIKK